MMTPDRPTAFHCHRFDTSLLQQVIEVAVDAAVRHLSQERGISEGTINQSRWVRTIVHHIDTEIARMVDAHELIPSEIDDRIDEEIAELINLEAKNKYPKIAGR